MGNVLGLASAFFFFRNAAISVDNGSGLGKQEGRAHRQTLPGLSDFHTASSAAAALLGGW